MPPKKALSFLEGEGKNEPLVWSFKHTQARHTSTYAILTHWTDLGTVRSI